MQKRDRVRRQRGEKGRGCARARRGCSRAGTALTLPPLLRPPIPPVSTAPCSWDDWKKQQDEAAAREAAMEAAVEQAEGERACRRGAQIVMRGRLAGCRLAVGQVWMWWQRTWRACGSRSLPAVGGCCTHPLLRPPHRARPSPAPPPLPASALRRRIQGGATGGACAAARVCAGRRREEEGGEGQEGQEGQEGGWGTGWVGGGSGVRCAVASSPAPSLSCCR